MIKTIFYGVNYILRHPTKIHGFLCKPTWDEANQRWDIHSAIHHQIPAQVFENSSQIVAGELYWLDRHILNRVPRPIWIPSDDEPVMVSMRGNVYQPSHSAGRLNEDGELLCYAKYQSKWTSDGELVSFAYWKRP